MHNKTFCNFNNFFGNIFSGFNVFGGFNKIRNIGSKNNGKNIDSSIIDSRAADTRNINSISIDSRTTDIKNINSRNIDNKGIDNRSIDSRSIDNRNIDNKNIYTKNIIDCKNIIEEKNIKSYFAVSEDMKINVKKLKRKNINRIPIKFSLSSPVNLIKQVNVNNEVIKRRLFQKTNTFVKGNAKNENKYFSIAVIPHFANNVKKFKISNLYIKFITAWVLFLALSIYSISYFFNIWSENRYLKVSINDLYSMNMKQNDALNEKYNEINELLSASNTANVDISELSARCKDIIEKYVEGRISGTIASRSGDRSGSTFSSDIKELTNILTELSQANESREDILLDLSEAEKQLKEYLDFLPIQWPVIARISSGFGTRRDPITYRSAFHKGIDIAAPYGTNIKASGSGKVIFVGSYDAYGQTVIIDHGNGLKSLYGHTSKILVKKGQSVNKETVIARVGSSGRSTGAHLHFEIRLNDTPVDPIKYLESTE